MDLASAIDVFTRGFAAVRNRTHPYLVDRLGPLWRLQDAPRPGKRPPRRREYIAIEGNAVRLDRMVRRDIASAGGEERYSLGIVHDGQGRREEVEQAWKALGYRYIVHEPFFVRTLPPAPRGRSPLPVKRVTNPDLARRVAKAAGSGQIPESAISDDDADWRLFAAWEGAAPVGWVSSIRVRRDAAWVANLYVLPSHRHGGVGGALMRGLLRDDAARGIRYSVLLASFAGARLYPRLGYEQIGALQIFTPRPAAAGRRKAAGARRDREPGKRKVAKRAQREQRAGV